MRIQDLGGRLLSPPPLPLKSSFVDECETICQVLSGSRSEFFPVRIGRNIRIGSGSIKNQPETESTSKKFSLITQHYPFLVKILQNLVK